MTSVDSPSPWWEDPVSQAVLPSQTWTRFDLPTVVLDTVLRSPRVRAVTRAAQIMNERVIQQDAAFDTRWVMESAYGLTNDPVGNSLVTGGPPRLRERNFDTSAGIRRDSRSGRTYDLSQQLGLLRSNSQFFEPQNQGNARLNLSISQPLMAGRGDFYNSRLVMQAQIDGELSWQDMRREIAQRVADVMTAFYQLHAGRCRYVQQQALIKRGDSIEQALDGRQGFDVSDLELAKIRQRTLARRAQQVQDETNVRITENRLRYLIGVTDNESGGGDEEWIPVLGDSAVPHETAPELADAMRTALEFRPEVASALADIESAALGVRVTRHELQPRLDAVFNGYLAGLNGNNAAFRSFGDQFFESGPGVSATLQYELPYRNRAARSRYREAHLRYQQAAAAMDEAVAKIRADVQDALVRLETSRKLLVGQRQTLNAALQEEQLQTMRYTALGPENSPAGVVLENLLESQQRRTDAERAVVTARANHQIAWVDLQAAMGTILVTQGVAPERVGCCGEIQLQADALLGPMAVGDPPPTEVTLESPIRDATVSMEAPD
ncbi:MAG: TolC family protein [Planctomycetota bacterium]